MGRNEIRLRRQKMSSGRIAQHRNYNQLMERHERDVKIRRITRTVIYFLIVLFLFILFLLVKRWENREGVGKTSVINSEIRSGYMYNGNWSRI
jgi:hypothetical protein